ncbi:abortive infection family protein [Streptomyces sp. NPDC051214]|uniref:abortive infection family protein n=1 Tax=Streptomyces sp. NPDC051214 TaxID=3155282 RepID=UPI00341C3432
MRTAGRGLAVLRNPLGLGHGRAASSAARTRHARLALNGTVGVPGFVLHAWQGRIDRGKLAPVCVTSRPV